MAIKPIHLIWALIVGYWIVGSSITLGLVFWSPQPLIDRIEAADPTPVSHDVFDFFEHTPRVEALLKLEGTAGYPEDRREKDRFRYGIAHLMLLLTTVADLLLVAVVTGITVHRGGFDMDELVAKPGPAARRVGIVGVMIILGLLALGFLVAMYAGILTDSRSGDRPSDNALTLVGLVHLILVVMIITIFDVRRRPKDKAPGESMTY
jgi:hypothetical protein